MAKPTKATPVSTILKNAEKEGMLVSMETYKQPPIIRIPTGIFTLDILTGGGIPEGRTTLYWGKKGGGKTTTALATIDGYLTLFPTRRALFVDHEGTFDEVWARKFISPKNWSRLSLLSPDYAEQSIAVIKEVGIERLDIGLIVIDSLATMIPITDFDKDTDAYTRAAQAKAVRELFIRIIPIMSNRKRSNNPLTMVMINQMRKNMKANPALRGPEYIKPCGVMQDFMATLDIKFSLVNTVKSGTAVLQKVHEFVVEKNKLGNDKTVGRFILTTSEHGGKEVGSFDDFDMVLSFAKKCGAITREGIIWKATGRPYKTFEELSQAMLKDPARYASLKRLTLKKSIDNMASLFDGKEGEEVSENA